MCVLVLSITYKKNLHHAHRCVSHIIRLLQSTDHQSSCRILRLFYSRLFISRHTKHTINSCNLNRQYKLLLMRRTFILLDATVKKYKGFSNAFVSKVSSLHNQSNAGRFKQVGETDPI